MNANVTPRWIMVAAALVVGSIAGRAAAADKYSPADRLALREFRLHRLFAMLGYLEQRATNVAFPWKEVGYGEAGNAWSGVTAEGEKLAPPVRDLVEAHEKKHHDGAVSEIARLLAGATDGEGVKALAKIELGHALEDVKKIDELLAGEPPPTVAELSRLHEDEAGLLGKFNLHIAGLAAVASGFVDGGSYKSQQYPDPNATAYLAECVSVTASRSLAPTSPPAHGADSREAAIAAAREALDRARKLSAFINQARQTLSAQLEAARGPSQTEQAACAVLDAAVAKLGEFILFKTDLNGDLVDLSDSIADLEQAYIKLAELGRENAQRASTICGYARRAGETSPKLVQTWKAEANQTVHQMAVGLENARKELDAGLAAGKQRRDTVVTTIRRLNAFDAMTLALPLLPAAQEAQAQVRAALAQADGTGRDMDQAGAEIRQLAHKIKTDLQSYTGDEEADRIVVEAQQLGSHLAEPSAEVRAARIRVLGTADPQVLTSKSRASYEALERELRDFDVNKAVARAKELIDEADTVKTVGEAKAAPAYQALQQALECFAKIPLAASGRSSTPVPGPKPPIAHREINAAGPWADKSVGMSGFVHFNVDLEDRTFCILFQGKTESVWPAGLKDYVYTSGISRFFQTSCNAKYGGDDKNGRLLGSVTGQLKRDFNYSPSGKIGDNEYKAEVLGNIAFQIDATLANGRIRGTAVGANAKYSFDVPVK